MQRKLVMADSDEIYIRRLAQALRQKTQLTLGIQIITERKLLLQYLETKEADWVFVSEELFDERVREAVGNRMTLLAEEEAEKETEIPSIWKYQSVDRLTEQIVAALPGRTAELSREFLGVYPSDGGFQSSVFGLSAALSLAAYGSVLYLNLDAFCPFRSFLPERAGSSVSDWMFRYRQGLLAVENTEEFLSWKGIQIISPPTDPEDSDDLRRIDLAEFLRVVSERGQYDWVVCQLSEHPLQAFEILDLCRLLYVPEDCGLWNRLRHQALSAYLGRTYGPDYIRKIAVPELPAEQMEEMSEQEFDRVYEAVWRDCVWRQLQKDRIL